MDINSGFLGPNSDGNAYSADVLAATPQRYGMSDLDAGPGQNLPDAPMDFAFMNVPDWQWLHQDLFFQTDPSSVIGFQSPEGLSNGAPLPQQQSLQSAPAYAFAGVNGNSLMQNSGSSAYQPSSHNDTRGLDGTSGSTSYCESMASPLFC